jgi:LysM repeat protein
MLRRILIIVLAAVVIIVAFFAIRSFLNRDSDQIDVSDEAETAEVINEAEIDSEESTIKDEVVEEVVVDAIVDNATEEDSAPGYPAEGDGGVAAPADNSGEAAPADDGSAMGGDAAGGDADAGGGVPAEAGDVSAESGDAAPALGDAVAVEPDTSGTGGVEISQPVAFVQPGVPTQHTAANQEWLTQLARCYGTTVADIQAANNYACPDLIHPGYVINITNPGNAGPITINDQPCFAYYTVQQGDTLYSIANMYGIDYQWLARINAIYNYNYIYAGQQLVIPTPVDSVFTTPPAQPFFYSNCWYGNCPVYPEQPIYWPIVPMPYEK